MPRKVDSSMSDLLLDTCAMLWLAEGIELTADARKAVVGSKLNVSPISVWEIANLVRKNRLVLAMPVAKWFRQTMDVMTAR
jgi:PIN domain nuclease of toxin-antitoxin system